MKKKYAKSVKTETGVSAAAGNNVPPAAAEDASEFGDFDPMLYIRTLDDEPFAEDAARVEMDGTIHIHIYI